MQYGRCWCGVLGDPGSVLLKRPSWRDVRRHLLGMRWSHS
jgi:hypothetical protein